MKSSIPTLGIRPSKGECNSSHFSAGSNIRLSCFKNVGFTVRVVCKYTMNSMPPLTVGPALCVAVLHSVQFLCTQFLAFPSSSFISLQELQNRNRIPL